MIWRVDRRETFEALRRARRQKSGPLTVSWVPGDPAEPPRVAYSVGRHTGSAVVRNRVRRRLRVLIRENASELHPGAYLIGVRPEAVSMDFSALGQFLRSALRSAGRGEGPR